MAIDASVVLVHGSPETAAVWDLLAPRLVDLIDVEPIRLSPPGYGAPVPAGFEPTPIAYRDWLIGALEDVGEPVHLTGHDWGGVHVALVAMSRPDLIKSWAVDSVGILEPDYEWHSLAQMWQQPGGGEKWAAEHLALTVDERTEAYLGMGMGDRGVAERVAAGFDQVMADTILSLYRAAVQPVMAQLGENLSNAAERPGLVLLASEDDNVGSEQQRRNAAARAGAQVAPLEGRGHWWMTQDGADAGATALTTFWNGLR